MEVTSCRNKTVTILHVLLSLHAMYMYTLTYYTVHMYLYLLVMTVGVWLR